MTGEDTAEVPLLGGRITAGVVRVGQTVRRPAGAASEFTAALLALLHERGFAGAPRYLGRDEAGRDMLSYIPGTVPAKFQYWSDTQVTAVGELLRAFHDATRGSELAGSRQVVCHGDPGPNNAVFSDEGMPKAFIDFEFAAPGDPIEDVSYLLWSWCLSSRAGAPPAETQAWQARLLADGYGLDDASRQGLVDVVLDRQLRNARWWQDRLADPVGRLATDAQVRARIAWSHQEHEFTAAHRTTFVEALRRLNPGSLR